jgi:surface protein
MRVFHITGRRRPNSDSRRSRIRNRASTRQGKPDASPVALLIPPSLITATSLQIDWTNDCTNEHNVKVYQSTINSRATAELAGAVLAEGATGAAITGLVEETIYYFWIEFFNEHGRSVESPQQVYSITGSLIPYETTITHSLSLDGTDDWMDIDPVELPTQHTVSWWHKKPTDEVYPGSLEIPLGYSTHGWGGYYIYWGTKSGDSLNLLGSDGQSVAFYLGSALSDAIIGKWGHIAVVRTEATKFKLYINGVQVDSEQTNASMTGVSTIDRIGSGSHPGVYDIEGLIDDVAFFDAALSAATISDMYNNGVPTDLKNAANIIHWWKLNNDALDAIGSNDGTLVNDATFSTDNPTVDSTSFISTWETTSSSEQVTLPFSSSGSIDFTIDWGDGSSIDTVTAYDDDLGGGGIDHTYLTADTYTITMTGTIRGFRMANAGDKTKIKTITQWGVFDISLSFAFYGCSNLVVSAVDAPTVSSADLSYTFTNCSALTSLGAGSNLWDVSSVTSFASMFNGSGFNGDISGWDMSSATSLSYMFGWMPFNGDISSWDVSSVTNFSTMFYQATAFNQDIGSWNTGSATSMASMFYNCDAFNQDIGNWDVADVTSMTSMFKFAHTFNQDISDWNTAKVTNMSYMFQNAAAFNQNINTVGSKWNTALVTNMLYMFHGASNFNGDITNWDISNVVSLQSMFHNATSFNQDISGWDTSNIGYFPSTFQSATSFNQNLNGWDWSYNEDCWSTFNSATSFNNGGVAPNWDMTKCLYFVDMFYGATSFNQDLSGCTGIGIGSGGTVMYKTMFAYATAFDQNIGHFDVTNVNSSAWYGMGNMLIGAGLSTTNYNATLMAWNAVDATDGVAFHGGDSVATGMALAARAALISTDSWTITDGTQ